MGAMVQSRELAVRAVRRKSGVPALPSPVRRRDAIVYAATVGPVAFGDGVSALARQASLIAPVKLALARDGTVALLAETPAGASGETAAPAMIDAALAVGWSWLHAEPGVDSGAVRHEWWRGARAVGAAEVGARSAGGAADADRRIPERLRAAGFDWTAEGAGYRVRLTGEAATLRVAPLGDGALRVWTETAPITIATAASAEALALFALEVNARFRLARVSLAIADARARVGWDAVVWSGEEAGVPEPWFHDAIEAVAGAHADTVGAVRAMAAREVATAYLRARVPQPRRPGPAASG